ncbi:MAG TPA: transaldolase, partial [Acidimicrobiia bacterium]|nr:transaldolase [Acidimicrobiia bacterium]
MTTASPLHRLRTAGVSPWSDQISREMLDSGELERRIQEDAITGVTSNPSIFAKAIVGSDDYDTDVAEMKGRGASTTEIISTLMGDDIQRGCDALRDVYERTDGRDGFVSVEVTPTLAHDTEATVAEAREWVKRIDRPNLLVKVPATEAGLPAIRRLIGEGISINVTLIFSLERYRQVMAAYLDGIETYIDQGGDPARVASVASFFVSRMDSEVDDRLEAIGTPEAMDLRGRTAIANARLAYRAFLDTFAGERWQGLVSGGARIQRPLWASTSTKNPDYRDTLYVEELVAPRTVNTMPLETIDAYQEHGPEPVAFGPEEMAEAQTVIDQMGRVGVDYDDVMEVLEREGVDKFIASWEELVTDVDQAVG